MPIALPHVNGLAFNHLDVAGSMQHVSGLAESLVETTARLKADVDKAPLLSKVSQAPPRAANSSDTIASPVSDCQTPRGGATRVNGMSTTEWLTLARSRKNEMCVLRWRRPAQRRDLH